MRSPFGKLSPVARRRALWASGGAWVGMLLPMLALEREMTRTGGPGIIPFELAGTPEGAARITRRWGEAGRAAARRSLLLDYPFLAAYASLQALVCEVAGETMRWRGRTTLAAAGAPLAWGQLAAGGFDAIENAALLGVVAGYSQRLPAVARRCAVAKFALLALGWAYWLCAFLARDR
jgi:hypothetical protein